MQRSYSYQSVQGARSNPAGRCNGIKLFFLNTKMTRMLFMVYQQCLKRVAWIEKLSITRPIKLEIVITRAAPAFHKLFMVMGCVLAYCSLRNEMGRNEMEMEICSLRDGNL